MSYRFCCCATDGSRGAVWQNGSNLEVHMKQRGEVEFLYAEKMTPINIHGCLPDISGNKMVNNSTVRQWVVCFSSGRISSGSPPLVHIFMSTACRLLFITGENAWWWWLHWKIVFCSWEFPLWSSVIVLFVSIVVSMEINTGCYFWSNPHSPCSSAFELTAVFIQA